MNSLNSKIFNDNNINRLMTNYLELIETKDEKTNLLLIFSEEIENDYNMFKYKKSSLKYTNEVIAKLLTKIRNKKKEYKKIEEDLNKLNNQISELGTRINKLKTSLHRNEIKKVKFLIPHTDEFRFMKAIYTPANMFDIIM